MTYGRYNMIKITQVQQEFTYRYNNYRFLDYIAYYIRGPEK